MPSNHVVLKAPFRDTNPLMQDVVLVHEALHVYTKLNDQELAEELRLTVGSDGPSVAIQRFFANGCER